MERRSAHHSDSTLGGAADVSYRRAVTAAKPPPVIEAITPKPQQQGTLNMPKLDERISSLETKLKQLKVQQQRLEARERASASKKARKDDARRKILIGATVLARVDAHQLELAELKAWLDAHLTREDDRALFELPPKEHTPVRRNGNNTGDNSSAEL